MKIFKMKRIVVFLLVAVILISEQNLWMLTLQAQELSAISEAAKDAEDSEEPAEDGNKDTKEPEVITEEPDPEEAGEETEKKQEESEQIEKDLDEEEPEVPEEEPAKEIKKDTEDTSKTKTQVEPKIIEKEVEVEQPKEEQPEEEPVDAYVEHRAAFQEMLTDNPLYALLYNCEYADLKDLPQENANTVTRINSGHTLQLKAVEIVNDEVWYQVEASVNDTLFTGYLKNKYVISADTRFEEWKSKYGIDDIHPEGEIGSTGAGKTDLSAFPSSYQSYIRKLIEAHPNWTFVPMNTGLDWNTVIANEMSPQRNLVPSYSMNSWKSTASFAYDANSGQWYEFSGGGWVQASESIVKYYMDPRNFLNETSVFQFELLTYNGSYHKESGVEAVLKNTFMSKKKLEDGSNGGITYAQAFMQIGKQLNVSPYFLASRVRQEQGTAGTSELISGTYPGFKGFYNYFNIQATGLTREEVVVNGLTEAKNAGWNTRYKALLGGAEKAANNYIRRGQDTLYLQKFDVDSSYDGLYWHQYMQNLLAADNEGKSVRNAYSDMGVLGNSFVFKIPVYKNMPSSASKKPTESLSKPSLKASVSGMTKVSLSWGEVSGATGYYIYQSEQKDSGFKRIKTIKSVGTTKFSHTVAPNKTYYYRVRAYMDVYGGPVYSSYSEIRSISAKVAVPEWGSVKKSTYTKAKVTWKKVSGVNGYQVYRKTGKNGKYERIKIIRSGDTTSYTDATVMPNKTYYFKVRAFMKIDGKTYYSKFNKEKAINMKVAKSEVTGVKYASRTSLLIQWKAVKWATGYRVFRSDTEKGKYKTIKTIKGSNITSYTDNGLKANKNYYYKVKSYVTVNGSKKFSAGSNVLMGRTKLTAPAITTIKAASNNKVKLKWKTTASATGYEIYRATKKNGKYKLVKTIKKNKTVSYTDKNLRTNRTYYYKVRAYCTVNSKTRYSGYCTVKSAKL